MFIILGAGNSTRCRGESLDVSEAIALDVDRRDTFIIVGSLQKRKYLAVVWALFHVMLTLLDRSG